MAKGKGTKSAERSNHAELLRQLWEAAVNLRGAIGPAEYKQYVLPIIFLRFLSVRYEQRRRQLETEVAEPESRYYAESDAERTLILDDEDSYRSAGVFPIPAAARWEYLRGQAQAEDVKIKVDEALEDVRAGVRLAVRRVLARRGVEAEDFEKIVPFVMKQAEAVWRDWGVVA